MEVTKACVECKMEKSWNEFHKDSSRKSGFRPNCKTCQNIRAKELSQRYSVLETREIKDKKVCYRCKIEKNVSDYMKSRGRKDGVDNKCRECANKYSLAYINARRRYDPEFKLAENVRSRLRAALKGKSKSQTTRKLIGIDFEMFTKWIEFQLEEGMTMKNHGTIWHIDHVLPLSSFNLLDEDELHKAMIWINLRPLTPIKNMQKSNKIDRWLYIMQEVK